MNKPLALLAFTLLFAAPAFAATDAELQTALVGTWGDAAGCPDGMLSFKSDGTFMSDNAKNPADHQEGTYTITGGHLNGKTTDHDMPELTLVLDGTTLSFQHEDGSKEQLFACPK